MHVHVVSSEGEAKFCIEPKTEVAQNYGLSSAKMNVALKLVEEHANEIRKAWKEHFNS